MSKKKKKEIIDEVNRLKRFEIIIVSVNQFNKMRTIDFNRSNGTSHFFSITMHLECPIGHFIFSNSIKYYEKRLF